MSKKQKTLFQAWNKGGTKISFSPPDVSSSIVDARENEIHCSSSTSYSLHNGSNDKTCIGFDMDAGKTWIYPTNYPVRDYQFNIVQESLFKNTMVVLPTGLGKTFIAAVVMFNLYRWYPAGKIVFMAPTKPLVAQQLEACFKITGIPRNDTAQMTGTNSPDERKRMWQNKRVFFLTPQTFSNDLARNICPATSVKCLVVDEAHKAVGKHAYCEAIRQLISYKSEFRVLALTATPGSDVQCIQQVLANLLISHMELRTEDSEDVKPYLHSRNIEKIVVPLGDELIYLKEKFLDVIDVYLKRLQKSKAMYARNPAQMSKSYILRLRESFSKKPPENIDRYSYGFCMADFSLCISLYHAYELLINHGIRSFFDFLNSVLKGEKSFPHARTELMRNEDFGQLMEFMKEKYIVETPNGTTTANNFIQLKSIVSGHPKLAKLQEIVLEHFHKVGGDSSGTRVMIFSQYRDSVKEIEEMLKPHHPVIRAMSFVGQTSKTFGTSGISQKQQLKVVKQFREGGYNTLISTCVGEEGLDIGEVDLIVCYDCPPSPVRLVQRMGRTGRQREGKIIMLLSEGKEVRQCKSSEYQQQRMFKCIKKGSAFEEHYQNSPRMIPSGLYPQCVKKAITIEAGPSMVKKKDNKKKSSPFLNEEEKAYFNQHFKFTLRKGPLLCPSKFVTLLPAGSQVRNCHFTDVDEGSATNVPECKALLSLNNWMPWQSVPQKTHMVSHSSKTFVLTEILTLIEFPNTIPDYSHADPFHKPSKPIKDKKENTILECLTNISKKNKDQPREEPCVVETECSVESIPEVSLEMPASLSNYNEQEAAATVVKDDVTLTNFEIVNNLPLQRIAHFDDKPLTIKPAPSLCDMSLLEAEDFTHIDVNDIVDNVSHTYSSLLNIYKRLFGNETFHTPVKCNKRDCVKEPEHSHDILAFTDVLPINSESLLVAGDTDTSNIHKLRNVPTLPTDIGFKDDSVLGKESNVRQCNIGSKVTSSPSSDIASVSYHRVNTDFFKTASVLSMSNRKVNVFPSHNSQEVTSGLLNNSDNIMCSDVLLNNDSFFIPSCVTECDLKRSEKKDSIADTSENSNVLINVDSIKNCKKDLLSTCKTAKNTMTYSVGNNQGNQGGQNSLHEFAVPKRHDMNKISCESQDLSNTKHNIVKNMTLCTKISDPSNPGCSKNWSFPYFAPMSNKPGVTDLNAGTQLSVTQLASLIDVSQSQGGQPLHQRTNTSSLAPQIADHESDIFEMSIDFDSDDDEEISPTPPKISTQCPFSYMSSQSNESAQVICQMQNLTTGDHKEVDHLLRSRNAAVSSESFPLTNFSDFSSLDVKSRLNLDSNLSRLLDRVANSQNVEKPHDQEERKNVSLVDLTESDNDNSSIAFDITFSQEKNISPFAVIQDIHHPKTSTISTFCAQNSKTLFDVGNNMSELDEPRSQSLIHIAQEMQNKPVKSTKKEKIVINKTKSCIIDAFDENTKTQTLKKEQYHENVHASEFVGETEVKHAEKSCGNSDVDNCVNQSFKLVMMKRHGHEREKSIDSEFTEADKICTNVNKNLLNSFMSFEDDDDLIFKVPKKSKLSNVKKTTNINQKSRRTEHKHETSAKKYVIEEAEVDDEGNVSADELENTQMDIFEESFIDDGTCALESNTDVHALYLQSVKNCVNQGPKYKLRYLDDYGLEQLSSQPLEENSPDYLEDSFCVGNDEIIYSNSPDIEIVKERKRKKKRKRVFIQDSSSSDEEKNVSLQPANQKQGIIPENEGTGSTCKKVKHGNEHTDFCSSFYIPEDTLSFDVNIKDKSSEKLMNLEKHLKASEKVLESSALSTKLAKEDDNLSRKCMSDESGASNNLSFDISWTEMQDKQAIAKPVDTSETVPSGRFTNNIFSNQNTVHSQDIKFNNKECYTSESATVPFHTFVNKENVLLHNKVHTSHAKTGTLSLNSYSEKTTITSKHHLKVIGDVDGKTVIDKLPIDTSKVANQSSENIVHTSLCDNQKSTLFKKQEKYKQFLMCQNAEQECRQQETLIKQLITKDCHPSSFASVPARLFAQDGSQRVTVADEVRNSSTKFQNVLPAYVSGNAENKAEYSSTSESTSFCDVSRSSIDSDTSSAVILVSTHELARGKSVINLLRTQYKMEPVIMQLPHVSYLVSNRVAVKRLLSSEFHTHSDRRKCIAKVKAMKELYEKCCVIIETDPTHKTHTFNGEEERKDLLFSSIVWQNSSVKILYSDSVSVTSNLLYTLTNGERKRGMHINVPVNIEGKMQQIYDFYLSLPYVSPICALNLVYKFPVITDFIKSSSEEIRKAGFVSSTRADSIFWYLNANLRI